MVAVDEYIVLLRQSSHTHSVDFLWAVVRTGLCKQVADLSGSYRQLFLIRVASVMLAEAIIRTVKHYKVMSRPTR